MAFALARACVLLYSMSWLLETLPWSHTNERAIEKLVLHGLANASIDGLGLHSSKTLGAPRWLRLDRCATLAVL